MKKPKKIIGYMTDRVNEMAHQLYSNADDIPVITLPPFYVCDQASGFYSGGGHFVVIPEWCFVRSNTVAKRYRNLYRREGYATQYIAHELSHVIDTTEHGDERKGRQQHHGRGFYETLVKVCPPEFIHFEADYLSASVKRYLYPLLTDEQVAKAEKFRRSQS